jgi:hypothetical protein
MHGLVNRSLQGFLRDTYGAAIWANVARKARLGFDGFEPMMSYDPALTEAVLAAAARILNRPPESVLEDLGTYLVSHPNTERVRRLLRFGGESFDDFLHSLEDLPERARLALPDFNLPGLDLVECGEGRYQLLITAPLVGAGHVMMGLLRAMADDYGALVLMEPLANQGRVEVIQIQLLDQRHSVGRQFDLVGQTGL